VFIADSSFSLHYEQRSSRGMVHTEMTNLKSTQKRERSWIFALAGGVAYLLLGVLLWWALDRYINPGPGDSTEKKDLVQALGLIMAGVAGPSASTSPGEVSG
jgi:hypothetical protein